MRIHLEGDWAATWTFGIGALTTALVAMFMPFPSGVVQEAMYGLAVFYACVAGALGLCAKGGREVPDGSTWVSWKNTGGDPWFVFFCGLFLYAFGYGLILLLLDVVGGNKIDIGSFVLAIIGGIVACWGISQVNFTAWIVVFTPNKSVMTLRGRPCVFKKSIYHEEDWLGLHVSWQQGYSGGMYRSAPDNLYFVWGVHKNGVMQLNTINVPKETKRTDAVKQLHEMVEHTALMTGLPVPPWPKDDELYFNLYEQNP